MSFTKSEYMLKYQKAKVKLLEYDVPKVNYPKFPLNYRELAFTTVLNLSEYADAVINDDEDRKTALKSNLLICAEFYDAAMKSREQCEHDIDFLLTGASAYFFQENYGSAMVLLSDIDSQNLPNDARGILAEVFALVFKGHKMSTIDDLLIRVFESIINTGVKQCVQEVIENKIKIAYQRDNEIEAFFTDIACAVVKVALSYSARELLPIYSEIENEKWSEYFNQKNSIKMIWPAQKLIGEKGILKGKSGIVQLPTGVGKTKSIELMIRSLFLSERGKIALVVAPLRALCNEITDDMRNAFGDSINVNQFSDLLEEDFGSIFDQVCENTILICTPEKLTFILHHRFDLLSNIDLLVFDEGHLFDDMNRGAMYELLIERIKSNLSAFQQIVLLSAVLPNADEILEWVAGNDGVLAYDEKIKSTPKVIGFASELEEVHYYSESFSVEDFYIPRAIKRRELLKKRKDTKQKYFPESNSQDIALYYSNQLCKNGGVAIYVSQRRSIPKILNRLLELEEKKCPLDALFEVADKDEIRKLNNFIRQYYGGDYVYSKSSLKGLLPHYSSLPNGLRLAVEYAFRKGMIKSVVCTSTLAQGVNIPIKYLIMTSLRSAQSMISSRNLQNLIGRTARSGVYTEGNIIIADPSLFDQRNKGKGYYNWKEVTSIFQPQNAEPCGSAILSLVQSFLVDYETMISGKKIIKYICNNISEDWDTMLEKSILEWLKIIKKNTQLNVQRISRRVSEYKSIIGIIENEICSAIAHDDSSISTTEKAYLVAMDIYDNSLAKVLANEEEKKLLQHLFETIANRLASLTIDFYQIGMTMVDVSLASKINMKIEKLYLNDEIKSEDELLEIIVNLYNEVYPSNQISKLLCDLWIKGYSYNRIAANCDISIMDVEKKCGHSISYQLSFLIGNIIDYLSDESINVERLAVLQKKIKYGVDTITSISICEMLFNERIIANIITCILGNVSISSDIIKTAIKVKKREIISAIEDYPSYFAYRIGLLN